MAPISVMLIDDNATFLRATTQFLEASADIEVVAAADQGDTALEIAQDLSPQVILVDLAMPGLPGLETIPRLRAMFPEAGIIALTVMNSKKFSRAALKAGADVFLPKATMRKDLLPGIEWLMGEDRESTPPPVDTVPHKNTAAAWHILVVEDDHSLQRLYIKAIRSKGFQVQAAATVEEVRQKLDEQHFDILLCDVGLGGEQSTDFLRENAEMLATSGARVIMVSGQPHYREFCEDLGAEFFLVKPVSVSALMTLLDRLTAQA